MKVTAFIRKKANGKTDMNTRATIYFRVRDDNVDLKAASELSINPNYWSQEGQGYKNRIALITEEKRIALNNAINAIKANIVKEYVPTVSTEWLQKVIYCYHHPDALKIHKRTSIDVKLTDWANRYWKEKLTDKHQQSNIRSLVRRLENYEFYLRKIKRVPNYTLNIDSITADDLREFQRFMENEHIYIKEYPELAKNCKGRGKNAPRSMNMIHSIMVYLRTIVNYYIHQGATTNNPYHQYEMPKCVLGTPIYMTIEERNMLMDLDLSDDDELAEYRDMFVFQCMVGCRHYDLVHFTASNIIDGVLEYIPHKTREKVSMVVRVPLANRAKIILDRRTAVPASGVLFPLHFNYKYNNAIKSICKRAKLNRMVSWLNPKTREEEKRPLYEIASSHMARRTFIGNLYNKVKDPALISSMSGHTNGSKAFVRYRAIDDDTKREVVSLIE